MTRLMTAVGVTARTTRIRPGGAELSRITGARAPSGVPVVLPQASAQDALPMARAGQRSRQWLRSPSPGGAGGGAPSQV